MQKKFLTGCVATMTLIGLAGAGVTTMNIGSRHVKADCEHVGYHYAAKASTCSATGNVEYWACCNCHEHFTTEPSTGTWTDAESSVYGVPEDVKTAIDPDAHAFLAAEHIGYRECQICHQDILMDDDDVKFSENHYGSVHDVVYRDGSPTWVSGADPVEGDIYYAMNGNASRNAVLPKVDYTAYSKVTFVYVTSATTSSYLGIGVNAEADMVSLANHGDKAHGVIDVRYDSTSGALNVSATIFTENNVVTTPVSYVNADVANGTSGLTLKLNMASAGYLIFGLRNVLLNHDCSKSQTLSNRTDYIGRKNAVCTKCGMATVSDTVMTTEDIYFENTKTSAENSTYGANFDTSYHSGSPNWASNVCEENGILWALQTATDRTIKLPRIDYTVYSNVVITWKTNSDGSTYPLSFGINAYDDLLSTDNHGSMSYGSLWIVYDNTAKTFTLTCYSLNDGQVKTATYSNENVASGAECLPLMIHGNENSYRSIAMNSFLMNHVCAESTTAIATDVIGYRDAVCACGKVYGKSSTVVMTGDEVSFKNSFFGSTIVPDNDGATCSQSLNGSDLRYVFGVSGTLEAFTINMPKVNYSLYSSFTFNMYMYSGWVQFGLSSSDYASCTVDGSTMTLAVTQDNGAYTATMTLVQSGNDNIVKTLAITDNDVITGVKGLPFIGNNRYSVPNRDLNISTVTTVVK